MAVLLLVFSPVYSIDFPSTNITPPYTPPKNPDGVAYPSFPPDPNDYGVLRTYPDSSNVRIWFSETYDWQYYTLWVDESTDDWVSIQTDGPDTFDLIDLYIRYDAFPTDALYNESRTTSSSDESLFHYLPTGWSGWYYIGIKRVGTTPPNDRGWFGISVKTATGTKGTNNATWIYLHENMGALFHDVPLPSNVANFSAKTYGTRYGECNLLDLYIDDNFTPGPGQYDAKSENPWGDEFASVLNPLSGSSGQYYMGIHVPSSGNCNGYGWYLLETSYNRPPLTPSTLTGPSLVRPGELWSYGATTTDPDGDDVSYQFDWDDGTFSGWTAYYPSGNEGSKSHAYSTVGTYYIKAKAKDRESEESLWSTATHTVIVDRPPSEPVSPNPSDGGFVSLPLSKRVDLSWSGGVMTPQATGI